jgi:hypothetical protein
MTIQQIKKELWITNKDIAEMFGLSLDSYSNSTAKKRYEDALIEFYFKARENHIKEFIKRSLVLLNSGDVIINIDIYVTITYFCSEIIDLDFKRVDGKWELYSN